MARPLGITDTIEVLTRLGPTADEIVLIGGQALNFWAERFAGRAAALAREGPFASKDIDFCGTQEQARRCAQALGGRAEYQSADARSLCVGIVHYVDAHREERDLDFLSKPYGLEAEPVLEMSFPVRLRAPDGREATLRIMHPLHCLMSRVANVGGLRKYRTDHGVRQLRASILCMRAFLEAELEAGERKTVNKLNEWVFAFCVGSEDAQTVLRFTRSSRSRPSSPRMPAFQSASWPSATRKCAPRSRAAAPPRRQADGPERREPPILSGHGVGPAPHASQTGDRSGLC